MIYVDRNKVEKPAYFSSKEHDIAESELKEFYNLDEKIRAQRRFKSYRIPNSIREALHVLFNNKCAYCETKVELKKQVSGKINPLHKITTQKISTEDISHVNHYRPKTNSKGFEKSSIQLDHYWWLTYEWKNLYLSCSRCNMVKSNWFPLESGRAKILADYDATLIQEKNLLLDPCNDDIEDHLDYDLESGSVAGKTKKGNITIEILNLNRKDLVNARYKAIRDKDAYLQLYFYKDISFSIQENKKKDRVDNSILEQLKSIINGTSDEEFLGIKKALIRNRLNNNPKIKKVVAPLIGLKETGSSITSKFSERDLLEITNLEFKNWEGANIPSDEINIAKVEDETIDLRIDKPKTEDKTIKKTLGKQHRTKDNVDEDLLKIRAQLKNVHIEKIELKNYKCFDYLKVEIPEFENVVINDNEQVQEHWLVFLGENGVGKSSLIKAVAMALMGQNYLSTLNLEPKKILKRGKRKGYIKVYGTKKDEIYQVNFDSKSITTNMYEPACYVLGYGSTRLLPKGNLKSEADSEYVKSKNLFDYSVCLSDAKKWLLNISEYEFNNVANSLKDLLLLNNEDKIKLDKKNQSLYIDYANIDTKTDVEELSDGYKSIFALTVDIIKTLSLGNLTFKEAEAIVLLDEIGTHLHPRWKMEVVKRLRKTFPKIQFIVTTHEPLCLRGLENNEVSVLKRDEKGEIISMNKLPNPSDFRVDQLLTSEYFGLNSTLDFETETLFREYYDLLAKEDRSDEEQNRVSELNQILPNKKHIGDDIRDELVYFVIDELLAKQVKKEGFKIIDDSIKQEALDRVKNIWEFMSENEN